MPKPIYVLSGMSSNALDLRERPVSGGESLADVRRHGHAWSEALGLPVDFRRLHHSGNLASWIKQARDQAAGISLSAEADTHTSLALRHAMSVDELPAPELRLSNRFSRKAYGHLSCKTFAVRSVTCDLCGFRPQDQKFALEAMAHILSDGRGGRA